MKNKYSAAEITGVLKSGKNIMEWIRSREDSEINSLEAIAYSYDAQAGSYTEALKLPSVAQIKQESGRRLASLLEPIEPFSLLEAGIGEATSLAPILTAMSARPVHTLGFDISLSRLLFARRNLVVQGINDVTLFTGSLDGIPLADQSIDVVLTIHAIEPNHGQEKEILAELLRVARRYLILIEPSYELGSSESQARMQRLGYVRDLPQVLKSLGHAPLKVERWGIDLNLENPAALIIIDKAEKRVETPPRFMSPISGYPMVLRSDCWFCPEDGHAFPIIEGIACLTSETSVLASKLDQF
jgi:hypothetical protein